MLAPQTNISNGILNILEYAVIEKIAIKVK